MGREFPACDGIITNQRGVALGIYVADCCAVYIVIQKRLRLVLCIPDAKAPSLASSQTRSDK